MTKKVKCNGEFFIEDSNIFGVFLKANKLILLQPPVAVRTEGAMS